MILKIFSTNQDSKFPNTEFTNDILFEYEYEGIDDVPYLSTGFNCPFEDENLMFLAIDENTNTVMGGLVLTISIKTFEFNCNKWVSSLGIHPNYKGNKISHTLIEKFFKYCSENNITNIKQTMYTDQGMERLSHLFDHYYKKYNSIRFIDEKKQSNGIMVEDEL